MRPAKNTQSQSTYIKSLFVDGCDLFFIKFFYKTGIFLVLPLLKNHVCRRVKEASVESQSCLINTKCEMCVDVLYLLQPERQTPCLLQVY